MSKAIEQVRPADLPASFGDLKRAGKVGYSINDDVEKLFSALYDDEDKGDSFKDLLFGAENGKFTVSGSTRTDDVLAAQMIQAKAAELDPNSLVAVARLDVVRRALGVIVSRRYPELSRKKRFLELHSTNGQ